MQNVSLQQAVKMTEKSESTRRRDVKKGKVSAIRDDHGHRSLIERFFNVPMEN